MMFRFSLFLSLGLMIVPLRGDPSAPAGPAQPPPASAADQRAPHPVVEVEHPSSSDPVPEPSPAAPADTPAGGPEPAKASASNPGHGPGQHTPESPNKPHTITAEEVTSLLRIGEAKTAQGDFDSAEIAFRQILTARATHLQDRDALLGMARLYRRKNEMTKAAAVYEKLIKEYPSDTNLPIIFLELGRTHRALGAYRLAISRFYSVINTTLKLNEEGADTYRQLARTAQYEVAETYFVAGDYAEAARFFSRLKLLDLAPTDRARAHFKSAYALHMGADYEKAVTTIRSFLETNPDDENTPEALYLLSLSLRRLGKNQESLAATLSLLRLEHSRVAKDPKRWSYWQRRTGNQLANEFYEQGDASSALAIYLSMAALAPEAIWRLPVLYQIGLCYERLRSSEKARESYTQVVGEAKTAEVPPNRAAELSELASMASWRLKHLDWQGTVDRDLNTFFQNNTSSAESDPPEGASDHRS